MNELELVNTPGYYYSVAYILAALIIISTNRKRVTGVRRYVLHACFFAVLFGFMQWTDGVRQILFLPSMAVSISVIILYIYLCCDFTLPEAVYYCARAFICGEFAASFCWQIYCIMKTTR